MSKQLVMGSEDTRQVWEADREMLAWLAKKHPCPYCIGEILPEEELDEPEPGCSLCDGTGEVTGAEIEKLALATHQDWLLPSWWPHKPRSLPVGYRFTIPKA